MTFTKRILKAELCVRNSELCFSGRVLFLGSLYLERGKGGGRGVQKARQIFSFLIQTSFFYISRIWDTCLLITAGSFFGDLMRSCLLTLNLPNTTWISLTDTPNSSARNRTM